MELDKETYTKEEVIELINEAYENGLEKGIKLSEEKLEENAKIIAKYHSMLNLS